MNKLILLSSFLFCYASMIAQLEPIIVSEQTIKVKSNEEFYFAFAKGDEIVFDLEVVKGKNLKEVEIVEYPNSSKFFEFKTKNISNKNMYLWRYIYNFGEWKRLKFFVVLLMLLTAIY